MLCAKTVSSRVVRHLLAYLSMHKQLVGGIPLNANFVHEVNHPLARRSCILWHFNCCLLTGKAIYSSVLWLQKKYWYLGHNCPTLQRGLSAIAELLVYLYDIYMISDYLLLCTQFTHNDMKTKKVRQMHYLEKHCAHKRLWLRDRSTREHVACSQRQRNMLYHACKELEFIDVAHKIFVTIQLANCNKYILKINTPTSYLTLCVLLSFKNLLVHCFGLTQLWHSCSYPIPFLSISFLSAVCCM